MSWTEIAVDVARMIAGQHGCQLAAFSLDGVDTFEDNGTEVIVIQASATLHRPVEDDEIPGFERLPIGS